jgi:hypothetical protein
MDPQDDIVILIVYTLIAIIMICTYLLPFLGP